MGGNPATIKMCKITLISYYRYKIYIAAGEKVTKITRRYSRSLLDNPVPDTFPRLEYRTKQQNPDKRNSTCLSRPCCATTAIKEGCSNQKQTNTNVKQTDKLGPKAAQSFVILPQGYQKPEIPDERMSGGDTLPDHEVRRPEADSVMFHGLKKPKKQKTCTRWHNELNPHTDNHFLTTTKNYIRL